MPDGSALTSLIDTDRYPIHHRSSAAHVAAVEPFLQSFRAEGWCRIGGFLRAASLEQLIGEAVALAPLGHRRAGSPSMVTVASDLFPTVSSLRSLHQSDDLVAFLAAVASSPTLARSSDPLTALNLTVMLDGDASPGEEIATGVAAYLLLQPAERGGAVALVSGGSTATEPDLGAGDLLLLDRTRLDRRVSAVAGRVARYEVRLALRAASGDSVSDSVKLGTYGRLVAQRRRG